MTQMKVAIKQTYCDVDAIMFEAALVANAKKPKKNEKNTSVDSAQKINETYAMND